MLIRTIAVASIAAVGTLAAQAQTPDKFCEGLGQAIRAAAETPPFSSLAFKSMMGKKPPGMEDAQVCRRMFTPAKNEPGLFPIHGFDCDWIFPITPLPDLGSASSISARVSACLGPAWTTEPPREDHGAHLQTFNQRTGNVSVMATEGAAMTMTGKRAGHSASIMVIALPANITFKRP